MGAPLANEDRDKALPGEPYVQFNVWRAVLATGLLGGLFAILFFVLVPGSGNSVDVGPAGAIRGAEIIATPGAKGAASFADRIQPALPWLIPVPLILIASAVAMTRWRSRIATGAMLLVAVGLFVTGVRFIETAEAGTAGIRVGQVARNFEASNMEGERFALSELRGRPVVINFWATWCVSCLAEMPVLEQQRLARQDEGLTIVAVNVQESLADARGFIEALGLYDFIIAMDIDVTISDTYGVRGLPHSVFIDRNGVVQATFQGQLDEETMNRYVQASIDAAPGGEPPDRIQFLNVVPREHVLNVFADAGEPNIVRFESRRLRCDDEYCGALAVEPLAEIEGVLAVDHRSDDAPPSVTVTFDLEVVQLDTIVQSLADSLRALEDRLYTRDLEVRFPDS